MLAADFVGLHNTHDIVVNVLVPFLAWTKANKPVILLIKTLHSSCYDTLCCANCLPAPSPPPLAHTQCLQA